MEVDSGLWLEPILCACGCAQAFLPSTVYDCVMVVKQRGFVIKRILMWIHVYSCSCFSRRLICAPNFSHGRREKKTSSAQLFILSGSQEHCLKQCSWWYWGMIEKYVSLTAWLILINTSIAEFTVCVCVCLFLILRLVLFYRNILCKVGDEMLESHWHTYS